MEGSNLQLEESYLTLQHFPEVVWISSTPLSNICFVGNCQFLFESSLSLLGYVYLFYFY